MMLTKDCEDYDVEAYYYGDHDDDIYDDENATDVPTMIKIIMQMKMIMR
jgi:hypothetical protein